MSEATIRRLSEFFEIGAHTLDHLALTSLAEDEARRQIVDSKSWVEDVTGRPCRMFCPPLGYFAAAHHQMIRQAGFLGYRTVEMLSTDRPRSDRDLWVLPTTLQAHPHPRSAYIRNALKRRSMAAFGRAMKYRGQDQWPENVERLLARSHHHHGVFHLWGHSWELDSHDQWDRLSLTLGRLQQAITEGNAQAHTNGSLCG